MGSKRSVLSRRISVWPRRLEVRTLAFQAGSTGSIPVGVIFFDPAGSGVKL